MKSTSGGTTFTFSAKFAICTVPLGVLKKRGSTLFSPALPSAKQGAITRLGMGLLNKVILEFPSASINSGPFADGSWWISRLPEAAGDNGYWQEFFNLRRALNVPVLVAFQAGLPAVNAENSMSDAATIASVSHIWFGRTYRVDTIDWSGLGVVLWGKSAYIVGNTCKFLPQSAVNEPAPHWGSVWSPAGTDDAGAGACGDIVTARVSCCME